MTELWSLLLFWYFSPSSQRSTFNIHEYLFSPLKSRSPDCMLSHTGLIHSSGSLFSFGNCRGGAGMTANQMQVVTWYHVLIPDRQGRNMPDRLARRGRWRCRTRPDWEITGCHLEKRRGKRRGRGRVSWEDRGRGERERMDG